MKSLERMSTRKLKELRKETLAILLARRKQERRAISLRRVEVFISRLNGTEYAELAEKYERTVTTVQADFEKMLRRLLYWDDAALKTKLGIHQSVWELPRNWYVDHKNTLLAAVADYRKSSGI
jgi:hypothetical protein